MAIVDFVEGRRIIIEELVFLEANSRRVSLGKIGWISTFEGEVGDGKEMGIFPIHTKPSKA